MRHAERTPPFRTAAGGIVPESIAEVGHCRPRGSDQWVMIHGQNLANPALIHLHGFMDEAATFNGAMVDMERPLVAQ